MNHGDHAVLIILYNIMCFTYGRKSVRNQNAEFTQQPKSANRTSETLMVTFYGADLI